MSRKEEKVSLSDFENIYNSNIYMYTNVKFFVSTCVQHISVIKVKITLKCSYYCKDHVTIYKNNKLLPTVSQCPTTLTTHIFMYEL